METDFSFENSKRIIAQRAEIHWTFDELARSLDWARKDIISEVNKQIYELAERNKVSVYDICFTYKPSERREYDMDGLTCTVEVELIPIQFELEKGGGYWKDKYFKLKNQIQELIDK